MSIKRLRSVGLCALLAACAEAPVPPPAPPPAIVADGTYRVVVTLTDMAPGFEKRWCDSTPSPTLVVSDNAFSLAMPHPGMPGNPTPVYDVKVNQDGSFKVENEAGVMLGRLDGSTLTGKVNGTVCYYDFSAVRI